MRNIITFVGVLVGTLTGLSQGTVLFANRVVRDGVAILDVPIFYLGTELLAGERFKAQLYVGADNTPFSVLQPVGAPVSFLTGASAGYFDGGVLILDSFPPRTPITAMVVAWDSTRPPQFSTAGPPYDPNSVSVWDYSPLFSVTTGAAGDPSAPPAILQGLSPFTLLIPEPSPVALGGLASGIFVIVRWFRRSSKTIGGWR